MAQKIIAEICLKANIESKLLEVQELDSDNILVSKFNWDYLEALKFQEACVDYVYQNPKTSIFIATNHPACLTVGRGLQKKVGDTTELVDFSDWQRSQVKIPVYDIKRGGGVTFHHPGQLVIYPIVNLTHKKMKVYTLMSHVLRELSEAIKQNFGNLEFDYCRDLLGLWVEKSKVASIGLQVRRFVTFHGVALNVFNNDEVLQALETVYPCGLPGNTYQSLSDLYDLPMNEHDVLAILSKLKNYINHIYDQEECLTDLIK